jgi:hypothetical protein
VTERHVAFKVVRGELVDAHVTEGVKMDAAFPHVEYIRLPGTAQETTVSATKDDQNNVRTKEDARIYGNFKFMYELAKDDQNIDKVYNKLDIDDQEGMHAKLDPIINSLGLSAVINVYKNHVSVTKLNDDAVIGGLVKAELQKSLDDLGFTYIRITAVIPSGVGLSDQANRDLEAIVSENRKLDLQKVQKQVAEGAVEVTQKQAAVTVEALKALRNAGVPENKLIDAYYLQLMRDGDHVGKPFVPAPVSGGGGISMPAVSVPAAPK